MDIVKVSIVVHYREYDDLLNKPCYTCNNVKVCDFIILHKSQRMMYLGYRCTNSVCFESRTYQILTGKLTKKDIEILSGNRGV